MDELITSIKKLRSLLNESQQAFANRLGISTRAVANYEAGRRPTRAVLYSLATLASLPTTRAAATNSPEATDLVVVFQEAYANTMRGLVGPADEEEQAWARMIFTLLRNRQHVPELKDLGVALLRATERLMSVSSKGKPLATDPDEIKEAVAWARRHITPNAGQQLGLLARARSQGTGEAFAKAFTQVLLENPDLYREYQKELDSTAGARVKIAGVPKDLADFMRLRTPPPPRKTKRTSK